MQKILKHLQFFRVTPLALPRVIRGIVKAKLGIPVLRSVELAITSTCQCKCEMCYAQKLHDPGGKFLTLEQISDIWKQCYSLGAIHVNITGGEPLLRKDVYDIIRALKPRTTLVSLVTNGEFLTEENVIKLKKAGLTSLQISIDSSDSKTHDEGRGIEGIWEMAIAGAKYAKKHGIVTCLSTVLSEESMKSGEIDRILKLAKELDVFLLFCLSASAGGWLGMEDKLLNEGQHNKYLNLRKDSYVRQDNMFNFKLREGCPAGTEKFYITAYGDVTPCDVTHISFGNVLKTPVKDIWTRMRTHRVYRKAYKEDQHCLRYFDKEYIKDYIRKTYLAEKLPITIEQVEEQA